MRACMLLTAGHCYDSADRYPHSPVELIWLAKQIEHWIRCGRDVAQQIIHRRQRVLSFAPGSIFAFVRWTGNDYGTVVSRIDILLAVAPGEAFSAIGSVRPGGDILLHLSGWPNVECVLQAIDAIEQLGVGSADACPDRRRRVHNRLAAADAARRYKPDQHRAWLLRRWIDP